MDGFTRPPQPPQRPRPMNDFNRPMQPNLAPRPMQKPASVPQNMQQPRPAPAPQQNAYRPSPAPAQQSQSLNFNPPTKQKRQLSKRQKLALAGVAVVLILGSFVFINSKGHGSTQKTTAQPATAKPFEKPQFTTYYPSPMPAGLQTAKGSIAYYKDSFTFIVEQIAQKKFFVYEQPSATDPGLNSLKSKLTAAKAISLPGGKGIEGAMGTRTMTAVTTKDNTILMVSCSLPACGTTSEQILSNMQLNSDLDSLSRNN